MVATHNKKSVQRALELIREHQLPPDDGRVCFGQLLGMGDNLTYPLASAGNIVNKVVSYGHVNDLLPFLLRRGHENRGMLENAQVERLLYFQELKRRLKFTNT
jgi:proline dehydrogenase